MNECTFISAKELIMLKPWRGPKDVLRAMTIKRVERGGGGIKFCCPKLAQGGYEI